MEAEKLRVTIMFADIQGSTAAAYKLTVEDYNAMLRDYHNIAYRALNEYQDKHIIIPASKSRLEAKAVGDECCMIIWGGDPGEDALHALRFAIYLKERWKQSDFVKRIRQAAELTQLYPSVDLRVGISSGLVMRQYDPWSDRPTFEGIAFNDAKRIEAMAGSYIMQPPVTGTDPLIMVTQDVKHAFEATEHGIEFGPSLLLSQVAKGVPENYNIYVFAIKSYEKWAQLQQEAAVEGPVSVWHLFDRAYAFHLSGQFEESLKLYQQALAREPDFYEAWNNMGIAYRAKGDHEQAIECYRRALEINPDSYEAWDNMGYAYAREGEYEQALNCFKMALERKFNHANAWANMAVVYSLKHDPAAAVAALSRAIGLDTKYRDMAQTDLDFENIRDYPEFRRLVYEES